MGQRVPEQVVVQLDRLEDLFERLADDQELSPVGHSLGVGQLGRLGDVPARHTTIVRPRWMSLLIGSFAAIWDDILPPTPEEIWQANMDQVRRALTEQQ
jgi:hypothetical protein